MSKLSELLKIKSWRIWFKAMLAAFIVGGASGAYVTLTHPPFTFWNVVSTGFVAAIGGVLLYLMDSPFPKDDDEQS